ncbi:MAG: cytochrome P450 [Actinobacteria bacterium]|nr:cytochrome P450 [Actinomycetota bacterium]
MPAPPGGLLDPATIQDPEPFRAWLRRHAPVYRVPGTTLHLVATWDLVTDVLARIDDFSSNLTALLCTDDAGRPMLFPMPPGAGIQTLATADPPAHTLHRQVVFPSLMERRMRAVEGSARATARTLVAEAVAAGRVDVTAALADPLPMTVLVDVMGLDLDRDRVTVADLVGWAFDGTELLAGTTTLARMAALQSRAAEAGRFLADQLARAAPDPATGILGAVARGVADGALDPEAAVGTLVILLGAGGESTTSLIGSAIRRLATDPGLQDRLRAAPAEIPAFVEEVLRLESPFTGHYRTVRRATRLGTTDLTAGDTLLLLWASANRDPAHVAAPDALRLDRPNPRAHLGFGRGVHHCVGAPLARMEARVALEELLGATTRFALDPERPPAYVASVFVRRHAHLDLTIEAART